MSAVSKLREAVASVHPLKQKRKTYKRQYAYPDGENRREFISYRKRHKDVTGWTERKINKHLNKSGATHLTIIRGGWSTTVKRGR